MKNTLGVLVTPGEGAKVDSKANAVTQWMNAALDSEFGVAFCFQAPRGATAPRTDGSDGVRKTASTNQLGQGRRV